MYSLWDGNFLLTALWLAADLRLTCVHKNSPSHRLCMCFWKLFFAIFFHFVYRIKFQKTKNVQKSEKILQKHAFRMCTICVFSILSECLPYSVLFCLLMPSYARCEWESSIIIAIIVRYGTGNARIMAMFERLLHWWPSKCSYIGCERARCLQKRSLGSTLAAPSRA